MDNAPQRPIATAYVSNRCRHSATFIAELEADPDLRTSVKALHVESSPFPTAVRSVPAVLVHADSTLHEGPQAFRWLRERRASALQPYAYDSGGPSPNTVFSFLGQETEQGGGFASRQSAFFAFGEDESKGGQTSASDPASAQTQGVLDAIIAQRNQEVPPPLSRR